MRLSPVFVMASLAASFSASLSGCNLRDKLDDIKDDITDYTSTRVIEGIMLGIEEPQIDELDLSETEFASGASLNVFLADATDVGDLENAELDGATVKFLSDSAGTLVLSAKGGGLYSVNGVDGLEYLPGDIFTVTADLQSEASKVLDMTAPQPVDLDLSETHAANTSLVIDLTDFAYDAVLVVVIDTLSGSVTYSNEPADIREIYDFTHAEGSVKKHEIPAGAFSANGSLYAVGVAGMRVATEDNFDGFNTLISSLMAGELVFYPVSTF